MGLGIGTSLVGVLSGTLLSLALWMILEAFRLSAKNGSSPIHSEVAEVVDADSVSVSSPVSGLGVWLGLMIGLSGYGTITYAGEGSASTLQANEPSQQAELDDTKQSEQDDRRRVPLKKLDRHTLVVPYDPEKPRPRMDIERILVPYELYTELWNAAHPEERIERPHPTLRYAIRSSAYRTRIESDDSLLLTGQMEIETWSEEAMQIPLSMAGGILTQAKLDGKPAQVKSGVEQGSTEATLWMHVQGKGIKRFELEIRFPIEKRGGWRVVQGKVSVGPATPWKLQVAASDTELRLAHIPDRNEQLTTESNQTIELPLGLMVALNFNGDSAYALRRWNRFDRGIDGLDRSAGSWLHMTWQVKMESRHAARKTLQLEMPKGWLIERVSGSNIRGWNTEESSDDSQLVEVQFLQSVNGQEELTLTHRWPPRVPYSKRRLIRCDWDESSGRCSIKGRWSFVGVPDCKWMLDWNRICLALSFRQLFPNGCQR